MKLKKALAVCIIASGLVLGSSTVATAAPVATSSAPAASVASAIQPSGWYYQCRYKTAWYDPWNWFGTYGQVCGNVWK